MIAPADAAALESEPDDGIELEGRQGTTPAPAPMSIKRRPGGPARLPRAVRVERDGMSVTVTPEAVRQLRERTGAGMMECKRALVETGGDLDAAAELMRKQGLAKADKKAARVAAEGVIVIERSADGRAAAMAEINCETDFVAREQDFRRFAADVARLTLAHRPVDLAGAAGGRAGGRRERRCSAAGRWWPRSARTSACAAAWCSSAGGPGLRSVPIVHGTRIGVLVALEGGNRRAGA